MTKELIAKLEALEAPDYDVFSAVAEFVVPDRSGQDPNYKCGFRIRNRFRNMIIDEAWESAAIMLVPEGWKPCLDFNRSDAFLIKRGEDFAIEAKGHPAIALLICILKAKEPVE